MYEVRRINDNTFKLFNTKTNKLLAPVYKTELTAKRNAEKKNCNIKCKDKAEDKFPRPPKRGRMPKPKKAKESFIKVEPVKMYGTATIENIPKPKKTRRRKKKEKVAPRKPKMAKDVAGIVNEMVEQDNTEPRRIWNRLKELYIHAYELYEILEQLYFTIDHADNDGGLLREDQTVDDLPELIAALKNANPDFSVPKSIISKISKIIRRNKEETQRIVAEIMDFFENYRTSGVVEDAEDEEDRDRMDSFRDHLIRNDYDVDGYFHFKLKDDRTGFKRRYSLYRNRRSRMKEDREDIKKEVKDFFELLVEYFEAKANTIRAKALINAI